MPVSGDDEQGTVDLWIAVAGAIGGMAAGIVVASAGYGSLALVGGLIAAAILPIIAVIPSRRTSV